MTVKLQGSSLFIMYSTNTTTPQQFWQLRFRDQYISFWHGSVSRLPCLMPLPSPEWGTQGKGRVRCQDWGDPVLHPYSTPPVCPIQHTHQCLQYGPNSSMTLNYGHCKTFQLLLGSWLENYSNQDTGVSCLAHFATTFDWYHMHEQGSGTRGRV